MLCDVARAFSEQLRWVDPADNQLVAELAVLGGYDQDLRADINRLVNRMRDALSSIHPPLEAVIGPKLAAKAGLRALLSKYPTPDTIRAAGRVRVEELLGKHHQARTAASLTTAIFDALDQQTLVLAGTAAYGRVIAEQADTLAPSLRATSPTRRRDRRGVPTPPFRPDLAFDDRDRSQDRHSDPG